MKEPLTKKQYELYDYLEHYFLLHGYAPTIQEMSNWIGKSIGNTWKILRHLELKGWINKKKNCSRHIKLVN